jgi:hypothetical protein
MGVPWKKLLGIGQSALAVGAMFDPQLAAVRAAIEGVERAALSGGEKHDRVRALGMAVIDAEITGLSDAQRAAVRDTLDAYIAAYVAARNAEAALDDATERVRAVIDATKRLKGSA